MLPSAEEQAERVLHKHVTLLRDFLGDDDPGTLNAINIHGLLLADRGEYNKAETLLHEVLQTRRETLGDDHGDTRISLGRVVELRKARVQAKKRARRPGSARPRLRPCDQVALEVAVGPRVLEREHKRKTAENAAESEERRRVRARAEEAKQSKAEKPLSLGPERPCAEDGMGGRDAWRQRPAPSARAGRRSRARRSRNTSSTSRRRRCCARRSSRSATRRSASRASSVGIRRDVLEGRVSDVRWLCPWEFLHRIR